MFSAENHITEERTCETCYGKFLRWRYDEHDDCVSCRQMKALERIAEAIEYWIGHR